MDRRDGSLQQRVTSCSWTMRLAGVSPDELVTGCGPAGGGPVVPIVRERKGREELDDLRPSVLALAVGRRAAVRVADRGPDGRPGGRVGHPAPGRAPCRVGAGIDRRVRARPGGRADGRAPPVAAGAREPRSSTGRAERNSGSSATDIREEPLERRGATPASRPRPARLGACLVSSIGREFDVRWQQPGNRWGSRRMRPDRRPCPHRSQTLGDPTGTGGRPPKTPAAASPGRRESDRARATATGRIGRCPGRRRRRRPAAPGIEGRHAAAAVGRPAGPAEEDVEGSPPVTETRRASGGRGRRRREAWPGARCHPRATPERPEER